MKQAVKILIPISLGFLMVLGLTLLLHSSVAVAQSAPSQTEVIQAGLTYIKSQQQPDGGILGFSGVADPDTTARSVLALVAAGQPVNKMASSEGKSVLDYLATQAITFTHDTTGTLFPGRAGLLLAAISAAGEDPSAFGGMDVAGELEKSFHPDTGAYSTTAKQDFTSGEATDLSQAWSILGLSLAGRTIPDSATTHLSLLQAADGSWGGGDPDTTALAVTALLASGKVDSKYDVIHNALGYFHNTQATSGGWKPSWDTDPLNADSTGWIIQALVSAGEDLRGQGWTKNNINPVDALLGLLKSDGAIGGTYANTYSTAEAIIGLAGIPLSNFGIARVTHRAGLAIFSGDTTLYTTACISYTETSITGLDLLKRSPLPIETATNPTQGTAVCKIGEVGDASNNCFGSMPNYWAYWQLGKDGWEYSTVGVEQSQVVDGGVYAWSWGTGNPPPVLTFQNICEGVVFVLPTTTATFQPPTQTSQPSPIATLVPTVMAPEPTAAPSAARANTSNYLVYAAILLVLGLVIIYLMRSRR